MKIRRYKHAKKYLNFYFRNFDFRVPHQILIDGTFTNTALNNQAEIRNQLQSYLGGDIETLTTNCAIEETKSLGHQLHGACVLLQTFKLVNCGHRKPIPAFECIKHLVKKNNVDHYFVATQDPDLTRVVNRIPGVPLLYLHGKAVILEKPSTRSARTAIRIAGDKTRLTDYERETLRKLKGRGSDDPIQTVAKRKRKGPKGPNPLSTKKKRKRGQGEDGVGSGGKKQTRRRRKRVIVAQHVRDELMKRETE